MKTHPLQSFFLAAVPVEGVGTESYGGTLGIGANGISQVNTPGFALTGSNAPRNSLGLGIVTDSPDLFGSDPFGLGLTFHVDFFSASEILTFDARSDSSGGAYAPAPIPNAATLVGHLYFAQTLWVEAEAGQVCSNAAAGLVRSRGLQLTIQP